MLTYGIPPEFRGGVHLFFSNRHTPSCQSRVYRVTQLRTDGVHCRESAGIGPVNPKVVPNECCLGRSPWYQSICASLSHTHYWYEVGMLKVSALCTTTVTDIFLISYTHAVPNVRCSRPSGLVGKLHTC